MYHFYERYTADHIFVNNRQTGTKTPIQTVEKVTAAAGNGSNYVRQRYGILPIMVIIV